MHVINMFIKRQASERVWAENWILKKQKEESKKKKQKEESNEH